MADKTDEQILAWLESVSNERPWRKRWASRTVKDEDFDFMLKQLCRDYEQVEASDLLSFLEGLRQEYLATRTTRRQLMAAGRRLAMAQEAIDGSSAPILRPVSEEISRARRKALEPKDHRDPEEEPAACKADIVEYLNRRGLNWTASNNYGWLLLRAVFGTTWRAGWGKDQVRAFSRLRAEFSAGQIHNRTDFERVMRTVKVDVARMEFKKGR